MSITVSLKISITCSRAYLHKRHLHVNVLLQMNPAWNGISRRSVSLFPRVRQSRVRSAGSAGWAGSAGLRIKKRNVSLFPRVRQFRVRSAGSADWAGSAGLRINKRTVARRLAPLAVLRAFVLLRIRKDAFVHTCPPTCPQTRNIYVNGLLQNGSPWKPPRYGGYI